MTTDPPRLYMTSATTDGGPGWAFFDDDGRLRGKILELPDMPGPLPAEFVIPHGVAVVMHQDERDASQVTVDMLPLEQAVMVIYDWPLADGRHWVVFMHRPDLDSLTEFVKARCPSVTMH